MNPVTHPPSQEWFEMTELRRRRFAEAVWVPLAASESVSVEGARSSPGWREELFLAGAIAFPPEHRGVAEHLDWHAFSDVGHGPYAFKDGRYKTAENYQIEEGENTGVELVFRQYVSSSHPTIWHVNQDLILALGLLQEGDVWVRPDEAYVEVMRQRRSPTGQAIAIEIKREFLQDYLAARGMALRLGCYRQRAAILSNASYLAWHDKPLTISKAHDRFQVAVFEVDAEGGRYGGSVAVTHMWRTDVHPDDEVPVFGPESEENTGRHSATFERRGPKLYRVAGELWREEWIEPAPRSERVRGDAPLDVLTYITGGGGERSPSPELNNEDVGRYLWFEPSVVSSLIGRRGAQLQWHTAETGSVSCSPGYSVHFGINRIGLLNVYAYDVARLPQWQQRIWHGCNVAPDGGVSDELLAAQMRARPASTTSPEDALAEALNMLDSAVTIWLDQPLFKSHDAAEEILRRTHRFRALDKPGLLALAKDVARLTADRIDVGVLRKAAAPPKGENWGSLKSLEKAVATVVAPGEAKAMLTPLVGIYELRLGDAHLPSDKLSTAWTLVGVDPTATYLKQGEQLLLKAARALDLIRMAVATAT
jgi:hypothetical protein